MVKTATKKKHFSRSTERFGVIFFLRFSFAFVRPVAKRRPTFCVCDMQTDINSLSADFRSHAKCKLSIYLLLFASVFSFCQFSHEMCECVSHASQMLRHYPFFDGSLSSGVWSVDRLHVEKCHDQQPQQQQKIKSFRARTIGCDQCHSFTYFYLKNNDKLCDISFKYDQKAQSIQFGDWGNCLRLGSSWERTKYTRQGFTVNSLNILTHIWLFQTKNKPKIISFIFWICLTMMQNEKVYH